MPCTTASFTLAQVRVLRSGTEGKGRWTDERVNVLEDYQKYFKTDPPQSVLTGKNTVQ